MSNEQKVELGEMLEQYFGCKKPFLKKPKPVRCEYGIISQEPFTVKGKRAYEELIDLVYGLRCLGVLTDKEAESAVDMLDIIAYSCD